MSDDTSNRKRLSAIPGLAVLGLMITGLGGLGHAFGSGDGIGLLASAIAFGIVFYVSFK